MSKRKAITVSQLENEAFYKLHKFLWLDEFAKMSNDAKVLYSLLRDRCELSQKNNWVDLHGRVYLIYTREEMSDMLNVSIPTIRKNINELLKHELITEKRNGLNKPNWIYINDVSVENTGGKEFYTQEGNKFTPNETEYNETENNSLFCSKNKFARLYSKLYQNKFGKKHPITPNLKWIEDKISEWVFALKVNESDIEKAIENHISTSNEDSARIHVFLSGEVGRSGVIYRHI